MMFPEPPKPIEMLAMEGVEWAIEEMRRRARVRRNELLNACDWTQVADAPVNRAAWAAYRQALRDVPDQPGFPDAIVWPDSEAWT